MFRPQIEQAFTRPLPNDFYLSPAAYSPDDYLLTQIEAFLVDRKAQSLSKDTLRNYRGGLKMFADFCASQAINRITQITPNDIRGYLLWLAEKGHNAGGVHWGFRTLKTFLYWWEDETEPDDWKNPIRKVKAPKLPAEPLQPVPLAAVNAMIGTCKSDFHGERDKAILLTLLDSGVRASELTAIDLADLSLTEGSLFIRQGKGRKPRITFIGKTARKAIRCWLKQRGSDPGALFTTQDGERLAYSGLRQILRRRAERADIPEPSAHDFRRAFCLAQLQAGVDIVTISRLMGHVDTTLIARYAKQTHQDLHDKFRSVFDDR